jgi:Tfp pilus assembly pilus retraction ATPase PilT
VLASLIAALEFTGADRIVLRPGELPHLIRGDRRHPLKTASVLTIETIEELVEQALSPAGKQALAEQDFAVETLPRGASSVSVLVAARRTGRDIYVELRTERDARPGTTSTPPMESAKAAPEPERPVVARASTDAAEGPSAGVAAADSRAMEPRSSGAAGSPMRMVATPRSATESPLPTPEPPPATAPASGASTERTIMEPAAKPEPPLTFKRVTLAFGAGQSSDAGLLEQWIEEAARHEATALYLRTGQAPVMRVRDGLKPLATDPLRASDISAMISALGAAATEWHAVGEAGWAREFDQIGQVRIQTFTDADGVGLAVQLSPHTSASSLQKDIPRQVRRSCEKSDGLVIVAAASPSGVMQMVAALAETTAQQRAGYLISVEPPNGLGHTIAGPLVSARRIGGTEQDIANVIRRATDEGPDVLVVAIASGAITEAAVRAATLGCLVVVGVVAPTAPQAIESLLSGVTPQREPEVRRGLAASFQSAFSYRALRGIGGRPAIVHDVIIGTAEVRARIEYGDFAGLQQLQRAGGGGMYSLDAGLAAAVLRGDLSLRQAAGWGSDRRELVRLVRQAARHRRMMRARHAADTDDGGFRAVAGDSFTT